MATRTATMTDTLDTPAPSLFGLLREDVRCVFGRDPAARSTWEVLTTYPGVHALIAYRLAHVLWQRDWRYPARLLSFMARVFSNVDIHPGARIGRRFFIDHGAGVVVGETAEIGNDVTLYHGVTLGGTTWNPGKRHPTLGDHVVVGAGAKILGAITIGSRVRVGANSVVVKNVPPDRTVVGIPARVVKREGPMLSPTDELNLDHHLMPDPVGHTLNCLLDRIKTLEADLARIQPSAPEAPAAKPKTARVTIPLIAHSNIDCQANTDGACPECACQPETDTVSGVR
ncbi:MAG: serine O-acetyltransferase [Betaproteobacteria bacterium HGW-Betaproteobacteria-19]|nr:MAG: serine O-acetyltransferase [Betaproteobacteria bacterium HGW-Betaproteobacteria-19]